MPDFRIAVLVSLTYTCGATRIELSSASVNSFSTDEALPPSRLQQDLLFRMERLRQNLSDWPWKFGKEADSVSRGPSDTLVGYDVCDVKTTDFQSGDAYSIRTFSVRFTNFLNQVGFDKMMADLDLYGHEYIQIAARDAHSDHCIYTLGLWGFKGEVDLQSPDWNVAILSKKLQKCLQNSTFTDCVRSAKDFMDEPLVLQPINATEKILARGRYRFSGQLGEEHVSLLKAISSLQKPTPHNLFGGAVVKMDFRSQCKFHLQAHLKPPLPWEDNWVCNCRTFTEKFHRDPKFLLGKVTQKTG